MRIALGADLLDMPRSGMGIALQGFLRAAQTLNVQSLFHLVHRQPFQDGAYAAFADTVIPQPSGPASGLRRTQFTLPRALAKMEVDLLHWPYQITPPVKTDIPIVISVWDIAPMLFDEPTWSRLKVFVKYRTILRKALANAAHVIAHSRAIAADLVAHFDLPEERITVVYPSVSQVFEREIHNEVRLDPEGLILYVGTDSTRKNLDLLLQAYAVLVRQGVRNRLALRVDPLGGGREGLKKRVRRFGVPEDQVWWIEPRDTEGILSIYRKAAVFAFPSLYEGFGMPLLEALAVGLPVVALDRSAMPEVVGEAGVLVGDNSPELFAAGILEALRLGREDGVDIASGAKKQASRFNWTKAVQETISVYERVYSRDA